MSVAFTPSTLPLLLLAGYLCYRSAGQLLPVAMFMSVFQAASVLNLTFGGLIIGVQPAYLILLLALAARFAQRRDAMPRTWTPVATTTLLLAGFVTYAVVSALIHPFLFQGVLISNPRVGDGVPLRWELGHLNQSFYLLLSFALYLVAAYRTTPAELTKSINWFVGGVMFASLVGLYQFLTIKTGLPFPREILDTSPTYAIFKGYEIDGFPRMNGTFTEAAAAAFYMTVGLALALWRFLSRADSVRNITQVLVIVVGLLITISTTGYICLFFLLMVSAARYLGHCDDNVDGRSVRVLIAAPFVLLVLAFAGVPAMRDSLVKLSHTVLLDKTNSLSYQTRTAWNRRAFNAAADTYWLGAGWGVCRASSFIPTILGNVGIPGSTLFFAFCARLLWPAFTLRRLKIQIHGAVLFGLSAVLLDLVVSAPEISYPIVWLLFAIAAKFATAREPQSARHLAGYPELQRLQASC